MITLTYDNSINLFDNLFYILLILIYLFPYFLYTDIGLIFQIPPHHSLDNSSHIADEPKEENQ
jgi:hypothetical protein